MSAMTRSWYDRAMTEEGAPSMEPLESSPWITMYTEISKLIDPHEQVVDLGCGTGRFIEVLCRNEHYAPIVGIDWSEMALDAAQRYAKPVHVDAPPIEWVTCDLDAWQPDPLRLGNCVYTCMEVLEHLPHDLELVAKIPVGHRLIISVPNFESESHVRIFKNVGDAFRRYAHLVDFRRWIAVGSERQGVHIYETRRRPDSW